MRNKRMLKPINLILIIAIVTTCITGCGKKTNNKEETSSSDNFASSASVLVETNDFYTKKQAKSIEKKLDSTVDTVVSNILVSTNDSKTALQSVGFTDFTTDDEKYINEHKISIVNGTTKLYTMEFVSETEVETEYVTTVNVDEKDCYLKLTFTFQKDGDDWKIASGKKDGFFDASTYKIYRSNNSNKLVIATQKDMETLEENIKRGNELLDKE